MTKYLVRMPVVVFDDRFRHDVERQKHGRFAEQRHPQIDFSCASRSAMVI
jgi:hypothetical protein